MFANGCMIFCKENRKIGCHVNIILRDHCNLSGVLVNFHIPMVQFLKGIEDRQQIDNVNILLVSSLNSIGS